MSQSRFITPTLQSNFNYTINEILQRLNAGYIYETWIAIKTLYHILPPAIHDTEEIQKQFEEMYQAVHRHNGDSTSFMDQRKDTQTILNYLAQNNEPFFRQMYKALYDGNYLDKQAKPIDTNAPAELLDA